MENDSEEYVDDTQYIPYDVEEFPNGIVYVPYDINTVFIPFKLYVLLVLPLCLLGIFSIYFWVIFYFSGWCL